MHDEATIAAQLAQGIPVEPTPEPAAPTKDEPQGEPAFSSNVELDVNKGREFMDYFGVDRISRHSEDTQRQIREVYRWASEAAQSHDTDKVYSKILELEEHLGIVYKPDKLDRIARWVEIEKKTRALRAQQEMIRHG